MLTQLSLSINPGIDKGSYVQSGSDDKCVRTDENPDVFALYGFCRPEARRSGSVPARCPRRNLIFLQGKNRKTQKSG